MLGRQSAAMQAATDGIAIYDDDGRIVYANEAYAELFGYESTDAVSDCAWTTIHAEPDRFGLDIEPVLSTDGEWRGELTATGNRADPLPIEASFTELESDEVLCVTHDISDKRRHERRLTGLATASRELLAAEDSSSVAAAAIETVLSVLGYELTGLWEFNSERNELQRTAVSDAAARLIEEEVAYDLNRSRAGEAYRHETTVRNEPGDDAYAGGSRADLHVPLGEYGVLTVLAPEGSFTEQTVQLVELFAESVRAAFIQADREEQLRERQAELERRTDELTVLTQFNSLVSDLIRSLLTATRGDIANTVCDRLAESSLYEGAWIATLDDSEDGDMTPAVVEETSSSETPSTEAGGDLTVSAASVETDVFPESTAEDVATSPFGRQLLADAEADDGYVMTRREFDRRGEAAAVETFAGAVPIRAGSRRFGVLAVVGTDDRGFGEPVGEGLRLLADTLGFAFSAELARSTLIADDAVELEFALDGPFATLSTRLDCRCCYRGLVDTDDDNQTYRIEFVGVAVDSVETAVADLSSVRDYRLLREAADSCLFALTVTNPSPELLAEAGVNLRSLVAEDGEVRLVVEAPEDTDITALRSALADSYGHAELVSKQHGRRDRLAEGYAELLGEELTDRQLTVVERAAEMGYFAWPREATAEDVAEALDISSATFHQHLRAAENKLVAAFLNEES
jgi:PAS domain S-box-containing protein